jgi:hypothetical protein
MARFADFNRLADDLELALELASDLDLDLLAHGLDLELADGLDLGLADRLIFGFNTCMRDALDDALRISSAIGALRILVRANADAEVVDEAERQSKVGK